MPKLFKLLIPFGVFLGSLAVGYIVFAWTSPSANPPANNVAAPLNVSGSAQSKTGNLYLGGSGSSAFTLNTQGTGADVTTLWVDNASVLNGNANVNSTLSVGSTGAGKSICLNGSCITAWSQAGGGNFWEASGSSIHNTNSGDVRVYAGLRVTAPDYNSTPAIHTDQGYSCTTDILGGSLGLRSNCTLSAPEFYNNSSRTIKNNFKGIDDSEILQKIDTLPVMQWKFIAGNPAGDHIGPFAEDFYSAFGLGTDDKGVNLADEGGITLAAVKALSQEVKELQQKNNDLQNQITILNEQLKQLSNK